MGLAVLKALHGGGARGLEVLLGVPKAGIQKFLGRAPRCLKAKPRI